MNWRAAAATATAVAATGLAGCVAPPSPTQMQRPESLAHALAGEYSNAAQYDAAPDDWKRPPETGDAPPWIDQQFARFEMLGAPAFGDAAVFLEWRATDASGEISRQRVWAFRTDEAGAARMDFFGFPPPAAPRSVAERQALAPEDLIAYGAACALIVTRSDDGFSARIPETCQIIAQSGAAMTLSASIRLAGGVLEYHEAGVRPDGEIVFRVPGSAPAAPYRFERIFATED